MQAKNHPIVLEPTKLVYKTNSIKEKLLLSIIMIIQEFLELIVKAVINRKVVLNVIHLNRNKKLKNLSIEMKHKTCSACHDTKTKSDCETCHSSKEMDPLIILQEPDLS